MALHKFVVNDNPPIAFKKGLQTADQHFERIGKSLNLPSVKIGETVYFHRPDGLQGRGEVLEVGRAGELLVMQKALNALEQPEERYLSAGEYYRSRSSCLTKSMSEEPKHGYPEVAVGEVVEYHDADGKVCSGTVESKAEGGHIYVKTPEAKISRLDPSAYWRKGTGNSDSAVPNPAQPEEGQADLDMPAGAKVHAMPPTVDSDGPIESQEPEEGKEDSRFAAWRKKVEERQSKLGGKPAEAEEPTEAMEPVTAETPARKAWRQNMEKGKKADPQKEKVREMAGEHISRHENKFGMDKPQAVAVWLSEARKKGIKGIPPPKKGKADLDMNALDIGMKDPVKQIDNSFSKSFEVAAEAKLKKAFTNAAGEKRWAAAVNAGKERSAEGKPHSMAKAGPLKGSPAYDKWITTYRTHHPQVFAQKRAPGGKEPEKLQHHSAKKLEELLNKKKNLGRGAHMPKHAIRQYAGMGGKHVAGTNDANLNKSAKTVMAKSAKAEESKKGEIALPSQAKDEKKLAKKNMSPSKMPPRAR